MDLATGWLIAVFAVSVAADLITLLTVATSREHHQLLRKLPRTALGILVLAFLGLSIVSGRALFKNSRSKPGSESRADVPENIRTTLQPVTTTMASTGSLTTMSPAPPSIVAPAVYPKVKRTIHLRDEITVAEQDKALPDVVAAADESLTALRSSQYTVRGNLRGLQSQPDVSLQGLITTDLILDVTLIDSDGLVHEAFTLTSRGGGFTNQASALKARERLRDVLRERIEKEHP